MSHDLFDESLFEKGLQQRKSTLGSDYVEKNLAAADDFTRPFQEAMTAWCWGESSHDRCTRPNARMGDSLPRCVEQRCQ